MKLSRFLTAMSIALSLSLFSQFSTASERGVFKGKSSKQHELTEWEQNKMKAEFKSRFSSTNSGAFQKLNNNPWEAKRNKQQAHRQQMLELSNLHTSSAASVMRVAVMLTPVNVTMTHGLITVIRISRP